MFENPMMQAGFLGLVGGLGRTVFAVLKAMLVKKQIRVKPLFLLTLMNALGGAFLGAVLNFTPTISLLAGYASFDLLDSAHKMLRLGQIKIPVKMMAKVKKTTFEEAMEIG